MISSISFRCSASATSRLYRLLIAAVGVVAVLFGLYRAPVWFDTWSKGAVAASVGAAFAFLLLTVAVAVRGSTPAVRRVVVEVVFLGRRPGGRGSNAARARAARLVRQPVRPTDHQARARGARSGRSIRRATADRDHAGTARRRAERRAGSLSGLIQHPDAAAAIRSRGVLPLTNPSNAHVVECNEGPGYLEFRSDEHGFNNPPGLIGPVDIAVIGESFALGHCVAPSSSAVV